MDGKAFRDWRKRMGWTQVQAGAALGVVRETILRRERFPYDLSRQLELACRALEDDVNTEAAD